MKLYALTEVMDDEGSRLLGVYRTEETAKLMADEWVTKQGWVDAVEIIPLMVGELPNALDGEYIRKRP